MVRWSQSSRSLQGKKEEELIKVIIDFFNHPFFIFVGGITTLLAVVGLLCTAFKVAKGLLPI